MSSSKATKAGRSGKYDGKTFGDFSIDFNWGRLGVNDFRAVTLRTLLKDGKVNSGDEASFLARVAETDDQYGIHMPDSMGITDAEVRLLQRKADVSRSIMDGIRATLEGKHEQCECCPGKIRRARIAATGGQARRCIKCAD